ncbi:MAG: ornithine carbamoyltransferase, partial [Gaiellales bacterium]
VVNGLTVEHHPCQALADILTIRERFPDTSSARLAFFGDGNNNVARSLIEACSLLGISMSVAAPPGYEPDEETWTAAEASARVSGATMAIVRDPREAAAGAHVLYTDVWTSMGFEAEADRRRADLALFGLDESLLASAADGAVVMHCLPAHVGEEITEALLYGDRSAVWDQAENRLHAQKALLALVVR